MAKDVNEMDLADEVDSPGEDDVIGAESEDDDFDDDDLDDDEDEDEEEEEA